MVCLHVLTTVILCLPLLTSKSTVISHVSSIKIIWLIMLRLRKFIARKCRHFVPSKPVFSFVKQFKLVKTDLKAWNLKLFHNFKSQWPWNKDKFQYVEEQLLQQPHGLRLNSWHCRLIKQCENHCHITNVTGQTC